MWDEVHEQGKTQYIQKSADVYVVVKQGSIGWLWKLKDQKTQSLLAVSKTASMSQEPAFQEAEQALAEAVEQLSHGASRWSLAISVARGNASRKSLPFIAIAAQDVVAPIHTLDELELLIDRELDRVRRDPHHNLAPYRRLVIYDALGPTYAFPTNAERAARLEAGTLLLTRADRVRARLALLTATRVLPIWDTELAASLLATPREVESDLWGMLMVIVEFDLSPALRPPLQALLAMHPIDYVQLQALVSTYTDDLPAAQGALLRELIAGCMQAQHAYDTTHLRLTLDPNLMAVRLIGKESYLGVASVEKPPYACALANAIFQGDVDPRVGLLQSQLIWESLGHFLGWDEEVVPKRALDCAAAAYEALHQVLGFDPFNQTRVSPNTRETDLLGDGAAATAAVCAESGSFDGLEQTYIFDPERQLHFWTWWLTEALPNAWRAEMKIQDDTIPVRPFRETVQ